MMNPILRPFVKEDIPAILAICETTWGGHDHLPLLLEKWLEDPMSHPYVLDIDGEVVGIGNVHVIDDGMTGWMEGLRVHEDKREQGLAKLITNHLVDIARQLRVDRIRLVTSGSNPAPQQLAKMIGMIPICSWNVFWKDIRQVDWQYNKIPIKKIQPSEVKGVLKAHPELIAMPDDPNPYSHSLITHWDVFEVSDATIAKIGSYGTFYYGANEEGAIFSIGSQEPSSYGPEWCFTLYATSEEAFMSGLAKNIEHAQSKEINSIMCIHDPDFIPLYDKIEWLQERNHELPLILHELYFKKEVL